MKTTIACHLCRRCSRPIFEHSCNGSLPSTVSFVATPLDLVPNRLPERKHMFASRSLQQSPASGSVRFNLASTHATTSKQKQDHYSVNHSGGITLDSLLANGAPYAANGLQKLCSLY